MKRYIKIMVLALSALMLLSSCAQTSDLPEVTTEDTAYVEKIIYPEPDGKKVVLLDAGHGFRDIGCDTDLMVGTEAEVTLAVTLMLKAELEARGVEVILTHDGAAYPSAETIKALADKAGVEYVAEDLIENDVFSAYERAIYSASIAEEEGIDLFLSLHVNSIENHPEISQYEIDYYEGNPYSTSLAVLAESFSEKLDNKTKIFADEYENAFRVTKHGTHPSMLFEMGYATNERDSENLNSEKWRRDFANTLADEIVKWISSFEEK